MWFEIINFYKFDCSIVNIVLNITILPHYQKFVKLDLNINSELLFRIPEQLDWGQYSNLYLV